MYLLVELMFFFFTSILPLWTPVLLFGDALIWKFIVTLGLICSCEECGFLRVIPKTNAWKLPSTQGLNSIYSSFSLPEIEQMRNSCQMFRWWEPSWWWTTGYGLIDQFQTSGQICILYEKSNLRLAIDISDSLKNVIQKRFFDDFLIINR